MYKLPSYFLPSLESTGPSIQEKKRKIDFQDGGHLGLPIRTILVSFDHYVLLSFASIGISVQELKRKNAFLDGRHGWI